MSEMSILDALSSINQIYQQVLDAHGNRAPGKRVTNRIIDRFDDLSIYCNNALVDGYFPRFDDQEIVQARLLLDRIQHTQMDLTSQEFKLPAELVPLVYVIAKNSLSDEISFTPEERQQNVREMISLLAPILADLPNFPNELEPYANARGALSLGVECGAISLDDLIQIYKEDIERFADFIVNPSADLALGLKGHLFKFIENTLCIKAAISFLSDTERASARDAIKRASSSLLKATGLRSYFRTDRCAEATLIRRELRGFLKAIAIPAELAKTDAGALFEALEEYITRRSTPLEVHKGVKPSTDLVGVGFVITPYNPLRIVGGALLARSFAQTHLFQKILERENSRQRLLPGYRNGSDLWEVTQAEVGDTLEDQEMPEAIDAIADADSDLADSDEVELDVLETLDTDSERWHDLLEQRLSVVDSNVPPVAAMHSKSPLLLREQPLDLVRYRSR